MYFVMFKGLFFMLTGIYMFVLCDIIELSNERGVSCMKLTNNLAIDAQLEIYRQNGFSYAQTRKIKRGLTLGFDMKPYAKAKLDVLSIREEIERLMSESNFDLVRRQKYHRYVSNIYLPLKAKLDLQF